MKLTEVQREILQALDNGKIIRIDQCNMAYLGERYLAPQTRYFLTEKRLVGRMDKTRRVEAAGNGFAITEKGRAVLRDNPPPIRLRLE